MQKLILMMIFLFSIFAISISVNADLNCTVVNNPPTGTVIFKMSDWTNAHAENATETSYTWYVNCSGVTGLGNDCNAASKDEVLFLSSSTNAHVEKDVDGPQNYNEKVCMSVTGSKGVNCTYATDCSSLGNFVCLASISDSTNAHVGNCSAYSEKVCCEITSLQKPDFQTLNLEGTLSYLNMFWTVIGAASELNITCLLNCDPDSQSCSSAQKCNSTQYPGDGSCSIPNPKYVMASGNNPVQNNVTCIVSYVSDPSVRTKRTESFKPIDFTFSIPTLIMATIGTPTEIKVNIKNSGLLQDSYNVSFDLSIPGSAYVNPNKVTTGSITKDNFEDAYTTLTILFDQQNVLIINVSSNTNSSIFKSTSISIKTGSFALPDFHLIGFVQIMLLAVVIFLIKNPRGRNY